MAALEGHRELNYMLIREDIKQALSVGKLIQAKPIASWAGEPRAFLMCEPLFAAIQSGKQSADEKERQRWARLEGSIGHFVEGGYMNDDLIKQLKPAKFEHWELICRKPRPSLRVFGRFYQPDVFVGTHVVRRDALGGMWSPQVEYEKLVSEDHCKDCGLSDPFSDAPQFRYGSYITENAALKVRIAK